MDAERERMSELIKILNKAAKAYYEDADEIMSNYEYDRLYDELAALEDRLGYVLAKSPTSRVGYEVQTSLAKERHASPMLSLNKTKDVADLKEFLGDKRAYVSWKLDGLTVVLTYEGGKLKKAVTRGDGTEGEVVTANARTFINLPLQIPYEGELILRGEAVISYGDFERINETIDDVDARYKNPRNLCSGSVRQLDSAVTAARNVRLIAFSLVKADGVDFKNSYIYQLEWLRRQGFETVEGYETDASKIEEQVGLFSERVRDYELPSDGLVLTYDDIAYGESLGRTAKFPRNSFAFKWADETCDTKLLKIEWSASRTGLLNPVAVFEPVELEGTTVSRASVHNISVMEDLMLGAGDTVRVYKANMIIPQIAENLTKSGVRDIPAKCPVCGKDTVIRDIDGTKTLYCSNPECIAKHIKSFALLTGRDALNIEGLSEATLEKFISAGFIKDYADIFHLDRYKERICAMEGFGEKSYANLIAGIEKARETTLARLIYGLGIPGVGIANAKIICGQFGDDPQKVMSLGRDELSLVSGIGPVLAESFSRYFENPANVERVTGLLSELKLKKEPRAAGGALQNKTFVITGKVARFANRDELKAFIEANGGKVTGSVTSKTDYLINNDISSASAKNKKAAELNVRVIAEEEFLSMSGREPVADGQS